MRNLIKVGLVTLLLTVPVLADGNMGQPIAPPLGGQKATTEPAKSGNISAPFEGSEFAITLLQALLVRF